jgi:hypothetical protein
MRAPCNALRKYQYKLVRVRSKDPEVNISLNPEKGKRKRA